MGFCGSPERPVLREFLKTLIRKMSLKNTLVKQISPPSEEKQTWPNLEWVISWPYMMSVVSEKYYLE